MRKASAWAGLAVAALAAAVLAGSGAARTTRVAGGVPSFTCSGGSLPGGTFKKLTITGECSLDEGTSLSVQRDLVIKPGAAMYAGYPDSMLDVGGDLIVGAGAGINLGFGDSTCSTPKGGDPCPATHHHIHGDLIATRAAEINLHYDTIDGPALLVNDGLGATCDLPSFFGGPSYSVLEDNAFGNGVTVNGLNSCWFGFIRNTVHGTVKIQNNVLWDDDAMEVATNSITGNLVCKGNSPSAQVGDSGGEPNFVLGKKVGECAGL